MAIWQADCKVIPKERDHFTSMDKVDHVAIKILQETFAIEKSWDSDTIQFGSIDSTCIEITSYEDDMTEIRCRFDMRNLTKKELNTIIDFVSSIHGVFVSENQKYEAKWSSLVKALKSSPAFKFCENPQKFFDDISLQKHRIKT